jgi:hypothetical protein
MQVAGLVPDGVTSVSLIYRTRGTATRVNVPVVQNTYVALVRGVRLGALRPTVVWHGPGGSRVVVKGGSTITPRMRRLMRRSLARDRAATRVPSVLPRVGRAKTIFTLRVRPPRPKSVHGLYVLTLRGPDSTDCRRRASRRLGATPASHGQRKGVIDILYGPGELGGGARWCRGAYNGRIELWPHGFRHGFSHRPYARFSFRVR